METVEKFRGKKMENTLKKLNRISGVFDWRFTAATNSRGTLTRKVVCASVRFTATLSGSGAQHGLPR